LGIFREKYESEVIPQLTKRFGYKNIMQAPKLEKIVINMGVGEAIQNIKVLDSAVEEIGLITGQRPAITKARKSIAQFKLRKGMPIGCMVTLRRDRMYSRSTGGVTMPSESGNRSPFRKLTTIRSIR